MKPEAINSFAAKNLVLHYSRLLPLEFPVLVLEFPVPLSREYATNSLL